MDEHEDDTGEDRYLVPVVVITPKEELMEQVSAALAQEVDTINLQLADGTTLTGWLNFAHIRDNREETRLRIITTGGTALIYIRKDGSAITAKVH